MSRPAWFFRRFRFGPRKRRIDALLSSAASRTLLLATGALLVSIAVSGCGLDGDLAEQLVEKTAERNERRLMEQQREELPLPDPELVPYLTFSPADLEPNEGFQVELLDDMVIGGSARGQAERFFRSLPGGRASYGGIAVDTRGRVFALDTREAEVRVFGSDGEFLYKFGRPGEGPGDLQGPRGLILLGDEVHIFHRRAYSTSVWSLDGTYLRQRDTFDVEGASGAGTRASESGSENRATDPDAEKRGAESAIGRLSSAQSHPDGSTVVIYRARNIEQSGRVATPYLSVVSRAENGVETRRYMEIPGWAGASVAIGPSGEMYIGMFGHLRTEHFVVALDRDGEIRWAMAMPADPELPPDGHLRVDGAGRLYVFPAWNFGQEDERVPVRVFEPDGELIGSGYMNRRPVAYHWQLAVGDHVYGVRVNPATEEWEIVRYRLRLP